MPAFRVSDLAARWQCSPHTVRAMIKRGDLKPLPFTGKLLRVSEEEVLRWEQSGADTEEGARGPKPLADADVEMAIRSARLVAKQHR